MKKNVKVLICVVSVLLFIASIVLVLLPKPEPKETKISDIYTDVEVVDEHYNFATQDEIMSMLDRGTGVILFSWQECPWCHRYLEMLDKNVRATNFQIQYYDIYKDREENNEFYKQVVEVLKQKLIDTGSYDESGDPVIYVPTLVIMRQGVIEYFNNDSSMEQAYTDEAANAYWDEVVAGETMTRAQMFDSYLQFHLNNTRMCVDEIKTRGCCGAACSIH